MPVYGTTACPPVCQAHIAEATRIGKPLIIGEFGRRVPMQYRINFYEALYQQVQAAISEGAAIAGEGRTSLRLSGLHTRLDVHSHVRSARPWAQCSSPHHKAQGSDAVLLMAASQARSFG